MRELIIVALATAGCGFGPFTEDTGSGGGADNLPIAGLGPYGKLEVDFDTPANEPAILEDGAADLLAPTLLPRADGGYRIWFERRTADAGGEIWAVEIPSLTELPDATPRPVLVASDAWEAGDLREPSVLVGDDGELILYYEAGSPPAIGRAVSTDGGQTFVRAGAPVLEGASAPSAVLHENATYLFYERNGLRGIFASVDDDDSDGVSFTLTGSPILQIGQTEDAFDAAQVDRPSALVRDTISGQLHVTLFYEGQSGARIDGDLESGIGVVAGTALDALDRPFPIGEAILEPGSPFESSPAVLLEATRGVMLFSEVRGSRARISAAVSP